VDDAPRALAVPNGRAGEGGGRLHGKWDSTCLWNEGPRGRESRARADALLHCGKEKRRDFCRGGHVETGFKICRWLRLKPILTNRPLFRSAPIGSLYFAQFWTVDVILRF